jgi:hypothetical protein
LYFANLYKKKETVSLNSNTRKISIPCKYKRQSKLQRVWIIEVSLYIINLYTPGGNIIYPKIRCKWSEVLSIFKYRRENIDDIKIATGNNE